jgi:hypothetical protein
MHRGVGCRRSRKVPAVLHYLQVAAGDGGRQRMCPHLWRLPVARPLHPRTHQTL